MAILERVRPISLPISWLDRRTMLGILLAALAGALVLTLTQPPTLVPVLVAGSDLPAGTPLSEIDVAVRQVSSAVGLVEGDTVGELADWTLRVPLGAGEPISPSLLVPPQVSQSPDALALSLDRSHAVQGNLSQGDLVDVLLTRLASFDGPPETEVVATGVYILDVSLGESGFDADRVDVVLAVDGDLAAELANARESGTIDLVRVTP
jgi:Flp pilus assembly protein CpaB